MIKRPVKSPEKKKDPGTFEKNIDLCIAILEFGFPAYVTMVAIYASVVTLSYLVLEKVDIKSFELFIEMVFDLMNLPVVITLIIVLLYTVLKAIKIHFK